ncbi:MAG: hypothetical protein ACOYL6_14590 [Bacteriovoracaceae bacterium]
MNKIFFFFLIFLPVLSHAQCFQEPAINISLELTLKIPCSSFPKTLLVNSLKLVSTSDINLFPEDFLRIDSLRSLTVTGTKEKSISVIVRGKITFPENFNAFSVSSYISNVSFKSSDLVTKLPMNLTINFQDKIFDQLKDLNLDFVNLYSGKNVIEKISYQNANTNLSIIGATALKSVRLDVKSLNISSSGLTDIEDSKLLTQGNLSLSHVRLLKTNEISLIGSLNLAYFEALENPHFLPTTKMTKLYLSKSRLQFDCSDCFLELKEILASYSEIGKLQLPQALPQLTRLSLNHVSGGPEHFPLMPELVVMVINDVDLSGVTGELQVNGKVTLINLNETKLTNLVINFNGAEKLSALYLLGNKLDDVEVIKNEEAKPLPIYFSMYVNSKKLAKKLRHDLDRVAVVSVDW